MTTVALARRSAEADAPRLYAGAILMASGVMYLRLAVFLALFNPALLQRLWPPFLLLAAAALAGGWLWAKSGHAVPLRDGGYRPHNPLEIGAALLFALLFLAMLAATRLASQYLAPAACTRWPRRWRQRRRPLHHGHHPIHARADAAAGSRLGHPDRRRRQ
ncbi:Uncharacterised protein [Chromobacterium violaceum]|uniref:DUF4010 domain-containing protein n=1 Tax=Chromobacterium violaceum TaxID=536 RepID=A0A447T4U0_CHRVL|nr:Uncharacterised protein [Chromobacterium violaceum]